MKTQGLDRIAILVKDLDQTRAFFSDVLGVDLTEVSGPLLEEGGVRIAMSFDEHLELVAPILPVKEDAPDITKEMAAALEASGSDTLLFGMTFRVDDGDAAQKEAQEAGLTITRRFDEEAIPVLGVRNLKELFLHQKDTCGLNIGLVSFEEDG